MAPIGLNPTLEIIEGKEAEALELCQELIRITRETEKDTCIYYTFSRSPDGKFLFLQELYKDVAAVKFHLTNTLAPLIGKVAACTSFVDVKVHSSAEDVPALQESGLFPPISQFYTIQGGHGLGL